MAQSEISKIIKALNERMADVGRTFGKDSILYERYENKVNRLLPANLRGESRSGFIKVRNTKEAQKLLTGDMADKLKKLMETKTRGEYIEAKRRQYEATEGEAPEYSEILETIKTETVAKKAIEDGKRYDKYGDYMTAEDLAILRQKKKSWAEINKVFKNIFDTVQEKEKATTANI